MVFAGIASAGVLFFIMVIPETRGNDLEDLFGYEISGGGNNIESDVIREEDSVGKWEDTRKLVKSATFPVFGPSTNTKQIINVYV